MTARHAILVHCDHAGCTSVSITHGAQSPTTGRADAGLKGWTKRLTASGHDYEDTCPQPHLAAAAPAVERATPDPDTLAALLIGTLASVMPGEPEWSQMTPTSRANVVEHARLLIAAGVTIQAPA